MRILFTSHRFWPSIGGTEEVVERLARACVAAGHDVTVFTSDEPGAPEREARDGYAIRRFTLRRSGKYRFPPRAYREAVLSEGWDVVHLHGQRVWSTDYLYRHLKRAKAPLVFTAHGFAQRHPGAPLVSDLYYRVVMPRALRHVQAIVTLTESEREELREFRVDEAKLRLIPNGIEPAEFAALPRGFRARHKLPPAAPLLLYVGGLYANKRADRLVELSADVGATLVVIGRDAQGAQASLEKLARSRGADVRFLGSLPREDVLGAYAECDLFVLASDFEGFGLVLLEAMASGLPFLSTPCGAAPELAATGAGVVAGPGALALRAQELLRDPARRKRMGQAGREAAQKYSWRAATERHLALYEEVARA